MQFHRFDWLTSQKTVKMSSRLKPTPNALHAFNERIQALTDPRTDNDGSDSGYLAGKDNSSNNSSVTSDSASTIRPRYNLRSRMKNPRKKMIGRKIHHAKASDNNHGMKKNSENLETDPKNMKNDPEKHRETDPAKRENENVAKNAYSARSQFQSMHLELTPDRDVSDTSIPQPGPQPESSRMDIPLTQGPGSTFYLEHHSEFKPYDTENDADDEGEHGDKDGDQSLDTESEAEKEPLGKRARGTHDKFPPPKRGASYWMARSAAQ